ncbi:helix-turn-helix domain-containing protein [Wenyingzhuangia heitensis]|nr:AraC family transcriptional regulator [Wenyingzhuangia heitensis]
MILARINNWINVQKRHFFTYSDGFFNMSFLANSPEVMVKSCIKLPLVKHNAEKQILYLDNPFIKGTLNYIELEKGLWIVSTEIKYKNNVSYTPVYDKLLPANYYNITLNLMENDNMDDHFVLGNYKVKNESISFLKPTKDFFTCHFKGSKESLFMLYFSEQWSEKNLINSSGVTPSVKNIIDDANLYFFNKNTTHGEVKKIISKLTTTLHRFPKPNILELKKISYEVFDVFFNYVNNYEITESVVLPKKEKLKLERIAYFLQQNLMGKFMGIEYLSKEFKISPTKLKKNFKVYYGTTILRYFQEKQMDLAMEFIKNNKLLVRDIAVIFGYENISKFSSTFKKHHHQLPSQVHKKT